jgi:hypothetical protein
MIMEFWHQWFIEVDVEQLGSNINKTLAKAVIQNITSYFVTGHSNLQSIKKYNRQFKWFKKTNSENFIIIIASLKALGFCLWIL